MAAVGHRWSGGFAGVMSESIRGKRGDVMSHQIEGTSVAFRGSERQILDRLGVFRLRGIDPETVNVAVRQVKTGHAHIECAGERFEVAAPNWSIVQDVYGCDKGRDCRDVSKGQREGFEAIIRARTNAAR